MKALICDRNGSAFTSSYHSPRKAIGDSFFWGLLEKLAEDDLDLQLIKHISANLPPKRIVSCDFRQRFSIHDLELS